MPQSLKAALRVAEDPDIPEDGRALVAGALVHWLSRTNTIPGVRGAAMAYVDDVLVLLLAMERLAKMAPDEVSRLKADAPELFETLDEDLAVCRSYLGAGIGVLEQALERVVKLKHMGRTALQCVKDEASATMLYEEIHAALIDFDLEPDAVGRELKDIEPIVEELRKRAQ
ncbi:MAG TPA: hypothetical protein VHM19_04780 [Polyangiales bacterium]|nr:hypothetical protein [Polyangiales bacterium]